MTANTDPAPDIEPPLAADHERLRRSIEKSAGLLPIHGPITAFVFLNTLQALEDLPFEEGLLLGANLFGVQPYLAEDRYREKLARGRIRFEDLLIVLRRDLAERADVKLGSLTTPFEVRLTMLQHALQTGPVEELRWFIAETDALTRFRDDVPQPARTRVIDETQRWVMRDLRDGGDDAHRSTAPHGTHDRHLHDDLIRRFGESTIEQWSNATWEAFTLRLLWRVCRDGALHLKSGPTTAIKLHPLRHRDALQRVTNQDSDALVNDVLIRFCAAFTDQGMAGWKLPVREHGFFRAFCEVYSLSAGPPDVWMRGLAKELARVQTAQLTPLDSIRESLDLLGVSDGEQDDFLTASLLALRGWAGMIWQLEVRPDRVALPAPRGSLIEFLAIRLILERVALTHVAADAMDYRGPLSGLHAATELKNGHGHTNPVEGRALLLFQLAQTLGWSPSALHRLNADDWSELVSEIESFTNVERRRLFHLAFERRFRRRALDAISVHTQRESHRVPSPRFQAAFCIDTREESFRRHIEEVAPDAETFSTAGFFNVPIYFRGVADAHFSTLCPIVVRPKHWVTEEVVYSLVDEDRRRARTRKAIGTASHSFHVGSRSIARGAALTAGLGVLASIPLVARVLFPRLTAQFRRSVGRFVEAPQVTRLNLERQADPPGPEGDHVGFNLEEMANIGERVLRDIGIAPNFARLFLFFGHGSFCLIQSAQVGLRLRSLFRRSGRAERAGVGGDAQRFTSPIDSVSSRFEHS